MAGVLALYFRRHVAFVYAFCSGALIGSAVIFLLPDAISFLERSESPFDPNLLWLVCAGGFLFFYLFERGTGTQDSSELPASSDHIAGLSGALGLATHSFLDGVLIGQGFQAGREIGALLALAVMMHKLADGVSAVAVMLGTKHNARLAVLVLVLTSAAPVAGVLVQSLVVLPSAALALLLSGFAGMFLFVGASRLLPEARRRSASTLVPVLSLAGLAFVYVAHALTR
jgi:ZIP family zinc transporter